MKKAMCSLMPVLAVALVVAMSGAAFAQIGSVTVDTPNYITTFYDVFTTNYFANNAIAGAPHGTFRATNDGSTETSLCANVYVFDDSQEFKECCSCPISPDGMRTWDINTDLNSNPANGRVANQGEIQVISTNAGRNGSGCDATFGYQPFYGGNNPVLLEPELESWATHVQLANLPNPKAKPPVAAAYSLTETASDEEELSYDELNFLATECALVTNPEMGSGSGSGVCGCGFEL